MTADESTIAQTIECLESIPKLDLPSMYELKEPVGEGQYARCFRRTISCSIEGHHQDPQHRAVA